MPGSEPEWTSGRRWPDPECCKHVRARSRHDAGCACSVSRHWFETVVSWDAPVLVRFASAASFKPRNLGFDGLEDTLGGEEQRAADSTRSSYYCTTPQVA
jgi:hypothetical protein